LNKIDENWNLFEHKTKIRTYLTKVDENWAQRGILTLILFTNKSCHIMFQLFQSHDRKME